MRPMRVPGQKLISRNGRFWRKAAFRHIVLYNRSVRPGERLLFPAASFFDLKMAEHTAS
jgi:hypothetical protein